MRLGPFRLALLGSLVVLAGASPFYSTERKLHLKALAHETWLHAYSSYKRVAFPHDELLPLSCAKQGHDRLNPDNVGVNDVMGDYALTLVDSLDTFPMLNDRAGFEQAVRETIQHVSFDVDSRVQVFEVTIRMMGGLLSGHLLALDPKSRHFNTSTIPFASSIRGFSLPWYKGELLELAHDLGTRLLPAFESPTGVPYARVHLQKGLRGKDGKGESGETCSAGAGSLLLEFITLSRLTGSPIFEHVARKAFFHVWNSRSPISLIGNTLDVRTGQWIHGVSSIGAGIDSFFEYAAKAYVLTGEEEYWRVWKESYEAIRKYVRGQDGFWHRGVNMYTGQLSSVHVDSLSAFFPGVQVLVGDLEGAIKSHGVFAFLWAKFGGIPELFDTYRKVPAHLGYPLRPEFIESNMYLYQATKDDYYLSIAEQILHDINNRTRVDCGFAAVLDLQTGQLEDKMPSFVTSETLKYLYLTFDEDSPFLRDDSAFVFTTEGHPLEIPQSPSVQRRSVLKTAIAESRANDTSSTTDSADPTRSSPPRSPPVCLAHDPYEDDRYQHYLSLSVEKRTDWEHARLLTGFEISDQALEVKEGRWVESGFCEVSQNEDIPIELLFASNTNAEVVLPLATQLVQHATTQDVVVHTINGLRFALTKAERKGHGYVVSQVGPYRIPQDRFVVIRDPTVLATLNPPRRTEKLKLDAAVSSTDEPPTSLDHVDRRRPVPPPPSALDAFIDKLLHPLTSSTEPLPQIVSNETPALKDVAAVAGAAPVLELVALAANFGPSVSTRQPLPGAFALRNSALPLAVSPYPYGCEPHHHHPDDPASSIEGKLVLLHRGVCSFALKASLAARSGARGVVVINSDDDGSDRDEVVVPSASAADEATETMATLVPMVLVGNATGGLLERLVRETKPGEQVWVRLREGGGGDEPDDDDDELVDGLVLGGYVVRNVKLGMNRGK
ncbi:hypothetical protein JCM11491_003122 [Sporobolomyces phaffii]